MERPTENAMRSENIILQGIKTPCLLGGEKSVAGAIFVHGNPGSGSDWKALLDPLSEFIFVAAPDMPGFGKAGKPDDFNYSIEGYKEHLNLLIEDLGLKKIDLVIHDFGGAWGLAWAVENADRVNSITLVNIGLMRDYRWHLFAKLWRIPLIGELVMMLPDWLVFKVGLKVGNPRGLPRSYINEIIENFDKKTKRAVLRLYRDTDVSKMNSTLVKKAVKSLLPRNIPCLVVWGVEDPYVPVKYAEAQKEFFPEAEVILFEDSGHWPFIDNPERFEKVLTDFLRKQQ
tara:strand:+ start:506 stop:1363 length:858 start_codon:yes stop_codon:yes gene_type:complete